MKDFKRNQHLKAWSLEESCCLVAQSCPTLCHPMDCSTPEFAQTHVHWVSDAIQQSHPLSPPSPSLNLSQHQGLFKWVVFWIRWSKYWSLSFSISPSSEYTGLMSFRIEVWSPCSPRNSQESSPAPQFKSINSSALSLLYGPALISVHDYWKNYSFDYKDLCYQTKSLLFNMLSRFVVALISPSFSFSHQKKIVEAS